MQWIVRIYLRQTNPWSTQRVYDQSERQHCLTLSPSWKESMSMQQQEFSEIYITLHLSNSTRPRSSSQCLYIEYPYRSSSTSHQAPRVTLAGLLDLFIPISYAYMKRRTVKQTYASFHGHYALHGSQSLMNDLVARRTSGLRQKDFGGRQRNSS